jgi:serine/threonine-protein kinase
MADIYLAVARGTLGFSKLVVLKHLRAYDDEQRSLDMFLDEARLAARLNHPNIVDTYDVGQDADSYFIAMEYLEGQSLSRILRAVHQKQIPATAWARIAAEALRGLHYAHELCDYDGMPLEIVHRDISPPNIFITYGGEIKIVDFGIAKATLNAFQTDPGIYKGKIGYMSPEQAEGRTVDRRADIFSMGVVLWEALVGRRLLEGGIRQYREKHGPAPLPSVDSIKPDIDPRLSRVVERALAINPNDRYGTAAEMGEALETYLFDAPDPMSKVDIGRVVMALFADHRSSVQRQIEKHLAAADRAVVEGDFWASSGIVIATDGQASPAFPPAGDVTGHELRLPVPAMQPSPSTPPHAFPDTEPNPFKPASSGKRWKVAVGGLMIAIGIWLFVQRSNAPSPGPAVVTPVVPPAPLLLASPREVAPAPRPVTSKVEAEVATAAPRTTGRRVAVPVAPTKRLRSSQGSALAEPQDSPSPSPGVAAQPEGPSPAAVAPVAQPTAAPSPLPSKQAVAPPVAPATAEPSVAAGTVDSKEVAATVRTHAAEVRTCLERARMEHPDLHGRLTVSARVNPTGHVLSTSTNSSIEDGARLTACVLSAFQSWTFPAPAGGVSGNLSYSFVFE